MSSSSERTRKKASQAIYNELATNVRNNHNVAPVKKNGYTYNSLGVTRYDTATTNKNQTAISNYASYAERMELKRGKQLSNTAINGTERLKYDIRAGNLLQVKYNTGGYNSPLVATGELDVSGGRIMRNDYVPYGNTIDYPGFITDYSNSIFKTSGIGSSENQQQKWVRNLTTQQHVGSHNWNKLNSEEQMTGFSLTSPILLWTAFDMNITTQTDVSGYIFNGTHRKGELQNAINPTLYYDVHDHINFNVNVDTSINISVGNGENNISEKDGLISLNSKQNGTYYYSSTVTNNALMTGKIIVGNGGPGETKAIVYSSVQAEGSGEAPAAAPAEEVAPTIPTITGGNDISNQTTNSSPSYDFSTNEAGTLDISSATYTDLSYIYNSTQYGTSSSVDISSGAHTITFDTLDVGTYSDISINVTNTANNTGTHLIPSFEVSFNDIPMPNPAYVHIVQSNGNKYVFNNSTTTPSYVSNNVYTLSNGSYTFNDISYVHPMAILNNSTSYISASPVSDYMEIVVSGGEESIGTNGEYYTFTYNDTEIDFGRGNEENTFKFMRGGKYRFKAADISDHPFKIFVNNSQQGLDISNTGDNIEFTIPSDIDTTNASNFRYRCGIHTTMMSNTLPFTYKTVSGTTSDGTYDFYYGDIDVSVNGDFGSVSIYCYHHGYMGGENLLKYTT